MQLDGVNKTTFMSSMQLTFKSTVAQYFNITIDQVLIDSVVDKLARRRRLASVAFRRSLSAQGALIVLFRCLVESTTAVDKSLELHEAVTTGAFVTKLQEVGAAMHIAVKVSASFTTSPKIMAEDPAELIDLSDVIADKYPPQDRVTRAESNSLVLFIVVAGVAGILVVLGVAYMLYGRQKSSDDKPKMKKIYMATDADLQDSKEEEKEEDTEEEKEEDTEGSGTPNKLARVATEIGWGPPAHIVEEAFAAKDKEASFVLGPPAGLLPELPVGSPLSLRGFLPPVIGDDEASDLPGGGLGPDIDFVLGPPAWLRGKVDMEDEDDSGVWAS
jgi:hypothetical protein